MGRRGVEHANFACLKSDVGVNSPVWDQIRTQSPKPRSRRDHLRRVAQTEIAFLQFDLRVTSVLVTGPDGEVAEKGAENERQAVSIFEHVGTSNDNSEGSLIDTLPGNVIFSGSLPNRIDTFMEADPVQKFPLPTHPKDRHRHNRNTKQIRARRNVKPLGEVNEDVLRDPSIRKIITHLPQF